MNALPELEVRQVSTTALVPYSRNARKHPKKQIDQIARSIEEYGFNNPILVDGDSGVIAGHGRLMAARQIGLPTVPVIELQHLDEAQKRAFILADNKLMEGSSWDKDLLDLEVSELMSVESVFDIPGFSADEMDRIRSRTAAGREHENEAPPLEEVTVAALGDIWLLGPHRVMCGDSTDAGCVAELLAGAAPHLMVTDPPYGVRYDAAWRAEAARANGEPVGARATGKVLNDDQADWVEAWRLSPASVAYVWHSGLHSTVVAKGVQDAGFQVRAQIIWVKQSPVMSRGHYHWQHEPAYYAVEDGADDHWRFGYDHETAEYAVAKGSTAHWHGGRQQSSVWFIEHMKSETGHSTQKPVECMRRPVLNNSEVGEAVYDPFLGSGTTLVAAESEGRVCYGMELEPAYVDVVIRRWQSFFGGQAVLAATGETFEETAKTRGQDAA